MAETLALFLSTFSMLLATIMASDHLLDIGVNWGTISSSPLNPKIVVGMLKDNGIKKVKLFDADSSTLNALAGTGIQVMVGIPNKMLEDLKKYKNAKEWVKKNVSKYLHDGGVDIRYVAVANEPFLASYNDSYKESTIPALKNIQQAIEEAGHADTIKVSIPLNADVYESASNVPSGGDFRKDIKDKMVEIVNFFKEKGSPFLVNIYPFLSLYQNPDFPEQFAFFEDGGDKTIQDKNNEYTNVFDANYDTLVWSLKKHGVGDLKIIVGEIGWPTDGHIKANATAAQKFYEGLLKKLASNKGTPMRPGKLEVYLFGLLDENMKSIAPGNFERHWGIFRYDGSPKFPLDLTGKGNNRMPIAAKGVEYQELKWCIFNPEAKDIEKVPGALDYACARADCTALEYGCSCNKLDRNGNISYAFNMYFQINDQDVEACKFGGLAMITKTNASQKSCLFPVALKSHAIRVRMGASRHALLGFMSILFWLL
ncbi:hypothetical protein Cgig2_020015 [Carnegiea gigantea]|uniref:glucan endo-1,3-beta-D-glucosidase n=1 Tax=Carnegiea gigantea TaxID=171969 RepID=A0A9Q1QGT3_9CARY|nr:hypothetical protein Cgig2_020015 [Carnegiea gigantea]